MRCAVCTKSASRDGRGINEAADGTCIGKDPKRYYTQTYLHVPCERYTRRDRKSRESSRAAQEHRQRRSNSWKRSKKELPGRRIAVNPGEETRPTIRYLSTHSSTARGEKRKESSAAAAAAAATRHKRETRNDNATECVYPRRCALRIAK